MNNPYLFVLGRHQALSRAELKLFAEEILYDEEPGLWLGENLQWHNPRNLPKSQEQLFLDRLGGSVRMAEVLGEFGSKAALIQKIRGFFVTQEREGTQYVGVSSFGTGKDFLPEFLTALRNDLTENLDKTVRIENRGQKNLDSGQIFQAKLLKKGAEFLIWQRGNTFLLARTVANQNIRNYTLRDHQKPFRDPHMGMLPPKLAQILLNFALRSDFTDMNQTVWDPFCGSGTVVSEAAILGYEGVGSDLNPEFLAGAQQNFDFLAEKFRFDKSVDPGSGSGTCFLTSAAQDFPTTKIPTGVIATEGWLGENFKSLPGQSEIQKNAAAVEKMWISFFTHLTQNAGKKIQRLAFCLPAWRQGKNYHSISQKILAKAQRLGYAPPALFGDQVTYLYQRPDAFVAREICVLERK